MKEFYQDGAQFYDAFTKCMIASFPHMVKGDGDMEGAVAARAAFIRVFPEYAAPGTAEAASAEAVQVTCVREMHTGAKHDILIRCVGGDYWVNMTGPDAKTSLRNSAKGQRKEAERRAALAAKMDAAADWLENN